MDKKHLIIQALKKQKIINAITTQMAFPLQRAVEGLFWCFPPSVFECFFGFIEEEVLGFVVEAVDFWVESCRLLMKPDEIPPNIYYLYAIVSEHQLTIGKFHMKLPYKNRRQSQQCILCKKQGYDYANPQNDPIFEIHTPCYSWDINLATKQITKSKEIKQIPNLPASIRRKMIGHIIEILRNLDKYNSEETTR